MLGSGAPGGEDMVVRCQYQSEIDWLDATMLVRVESHSSKCEGER